ncbi:endonuclease-reverse transcriptase [Brachionus plicatilis]|uniref:Endonuclease-reverse transcriptase n=1 Tax=Brachionus plicatilis TaxID=10195 RepID=A0A3M7QCF5_BRAPC|nr:endonuclease-reverse transcriptase [Brachionus plicatilis]
MFRSIDENVAIYINNIEPYLTSIFHTLLSCCRHKLMLVSPTLSSVYIEELGTLLNDSNLGIEIGILISNIFYSDDIILIANDLNELNILFKITELYGLKYEFKFNPNKTLYMAFGLTKRSIVRFTQVNRRVKPFTYSYQSLKQFGITSEWSFVTTKHMYSPCCTMVLTALSLTRLKALKTIKSSLIKGDENENIIKPQKYNQNMA